MRAYMLKAIESAMLGIFNGDGGPFGAVIVWPDGKISFAHNTVFRGPDSTAHAEINAIRKACRKAGVLDLSGCVIYSTTEPCPMCFSAIHWARVGKIVYGTSIDDASRFGFNELKIHNDKLKRLGRVGIEIVGGFMVDECLDLFEEWKKTKKRPY